MNCSNLKTNMIEKMFFKLNKTYNISVLDVETFTEV